MREVVSSISTVNEMIDFQIDEQSQMLREGFENVYFQKTSSVVRVVIKKVPDSKLPSVESQLRAIGQTDYIVKRNG